MNGIPNDDVVSILLADKWHSIYEGTFEWICCEDESPDGAARTWWFECIARTGQKLVGPASSIIAVGSGSSWGPDGERL